MPMKRWFQRLFAGRSSGPIPGKTSLQALRYVVLDTELTSLDPVSNRVISIGAIAMDGSRIRMGEHFYCVVNPGIEVPAATVLVHGLRPVDVIQGSPPADAISRLLSFSAGSVLVGHFLGMDLAALRKEVAGNTKALGGPAVDTARVQRWLDLRQNMYREDRGHEVDRIDLASLARRYGLEIQEAHHALYDALLTAQLWQRLLSQLDRAKVRTLRELLRIGMAESWTPRLPFAKES
jgi:DNA polymerase III subunit epsilon